MLGRNWNSSSPRIIVSLGMDAVVCFFDRDTRGPGLQGQRTDANGAAGTGPCFAAQVPGTSQEHWNIKGLGPLAQYVPQ